MKSIAVLLLIVAACADLACAAEPIPNASLLGSWTVDTSRLHMAPSARPGRVTITFSDAGPERLGTQVEVIDAEGKRLEAAGITPLDGTPTALTANFEADVSATIMPRPEVLIMQLGNKGVPASTRIYALGADGDSMIETVAYFDAEGQPVLRKNYFSRVP